MNEINVPGVYYISSEDYHRDPVIKPSLSRGTIKQLLYDSPAHVWWNNSRLNPDFVQDDAEPKFDIGQAAHSLFLEGIDKICIIDEKDWKKKSAQEERDLARMKGFIPLLPHQSEKVLAMVKAADRQLAEWEEHPIKDLRSKGNSELTYVWQEGNNWLRVRPDWISKNRKLILDYKTTSASANPMEWARQVVNLGYDIQYHMYKRGVKAVEGAMPSFRFMVQETYEPYLCSFIGLPPQFVEMGKEKTDYGIFMWEKCLVTGHWPGYPKQTCYLDPPAYALASWEARAATIGVEE
jgi:hypothetical protein